MTSFLITCNHATCAVPEAFRELFKGSEDLVSSVEGWEPGALNLAQGLAMKLSTPLIHGDVTRLLINLDEAGDKRWSKISATLPAPTRVKLVDRHEKKFRTAIDIRLTEDLKRHDNVVHLIIQTAPIADGKIEFEYIGSNYVGNVSNAAIQKLPTEDVDSSSIPLMEKTPFITWMLEQYPSEKYGIIRITVSQSYFLKSLPMRWELIKKAIIQAIKTSAE